MVALMCPYKRLTLYSADQTIIRKVTLETLVFNISKEDAEIQKQQVQNHYITTYRLVLLSTNCAFCRATMYSIGFYIMKYKLSTKEKRSRKC